MAPVSLGSDAAFAIGLSVIAVLVLLLLRHYLPLRSTPAYLLLPIFLALFLPASIILLVPIDLASSATPEDGLPRGIWLPERARLVCWRIAYWLIFVLTWLILPILGQYSDSGDREPQARLIYSLKSNGKSQLIILSVATLTLAYGFVSSGLTLESFKSMVMALPYAWGLIIAIYLMGHGLVAFPRKLFRSANIAGRLRQLQTEAPRINERLLDSVESLQALEAQVLQLRSRKTGTALRFQDWIEDLVDTADMPEARIMLAAPSRVAESVVPVVITERYMADLTRKLKRARHRRIRFVEKWDRCVQEAKRLQNILDAAGSRRLELGSQGELWFHKAKFMTPRMRYYVHANVIPAVRILFSGIFAIASACLAWSEIVPRLLPDRLMGSLSIVGLSIIHHPNSEERGKIGFAGQVMTGCWMLYMMTCTLTSIREVKIWGNRALVTRHTYAESACWYASQVARLTVPLSYNFTSLVPGIDDKTIFYKFLGHSIDLTRLGEGFSNYFPVLIIIPIVFSAFNLYGKIKGIFGYGAMVDEDEDNPNGFGTGGWREGKALIDRELNTTDSLGLASRAQSPRPASTLSAESGPDRLPSPIYRDATNSPLLPQSSRPIGPPATRVTLPPDEADENGNFFTDFAHRVRNTIDTVDKPNWVPKIDFKKPKWMGGQPEASSAAGSSEGIGRWFGGRPDNGKVRI